MRVSEGMMAKRTRASDIAPLRDPHEIMPIYVDGLGAAYVSDDHATLTFFVDKPLISGGHERIVSLVVIIPLEAVFAGRPLVNAAIAEAHNRTVLDS